MPDEEARILSQDHLEPIARDECMQRLRAQGVGRLGVEVRGRIAIYPVNYAVDDSSVLFRTNEGRKMRGAGSCEVAFEVDSIEPEAHAGWSVVIHGEPEDITGEAETIPDTVQPWAGRKEYLVRIRPRTISGRRVIPPSYLL